MAARFVGAGYVVVNSQDMGLARPAFARGSRNPCVSFVWVGVKAGAGRQCTVERIAEEFADRIQAARGASRLATWRRRGAHSRALAAASAVVIALCGGEVPRCDGRDSIVRLVVARVVMDHM